MTYKYIYSYPQAVVLLLAVEFWTEDVELLLKLFVRSTLLLLDLFRCSIGLKTHQYFSFAVSKKELQNTYWCSC